ncbi:MAG: malonyl-[acyl-carrier protein] O-methyltransferase BioC [Proteobacteria bacterium]|nr:MAG: malonyl-[acyl-carrier protein] O-methyltransferase BioC [Pseudomonadota bacterium]
MKIRRGQSESGAEESVIDKRLVAESFSRAAKSYDGAAHFQRQVANSLLSGCPFEPAVGAENPVSLLDMGCGTGYEIPLIRNRFGVDQVFAIDLAPGMVQFARLHHGSDTTSFSVADIESLPFVDTSFSLIHSSLAVQWCASLGRVLDEVFRCLVEGGVAMIATLEQGTLTELAQAWRAADSCQHVNRFLTHARIEEVLVRSRFNGLTGAYTMKQEEVVLEYATVRQLTRELKDLGAHNVNKNRPKSVTGRDKVERFISAYEPFRRENGLLPATYQVVYLYLRKGKI